MVVVFKTYDTKRGDLSSLQGTHNIHTHTEIHTTHMHACMHTHTPNLSRSTHTHIHNHSHNAHTHVRTHIHTLSLSHTLFLTHTHTHTLSLSHTHTHTHTHTQAPHTHTHAHFCSFYPPATGTEHFSLSQLALTLISISIMSSLAGFSGSFITSSSRTALIWRSLNWQM